VLPDISKTFGFASVAFPQVEAALNIFTLAVGQNEVSRKSILQDFFIMEVPRERERECVCADRQTVDTRIQKARARYVLGCRVSKFISPQSTSQSPPRLAPYAFRGRGPAPTPKSLAADPAADSRACRHSGRATALGWRSRPLFPDPSLSRCPAILVLRD
jgi:hypothetical protein